MSELLLRDLVDNQAHNKPNEIAYLCGDKKITWSEINDRANRLGAALQALGHEVGKPLGILAPETIEVYEHFFACFKIGAIRVGINRRFAPKEALHMVDDGGLKLLLVHADCMELLKQMEGELAKREVVLIGIGDGHGLPLDYETLIAECSNEIRYPELSNETPAMYTYTSGTTGLPKGVVLNGRALKVVIEQAPLNFGFVPHDRFYCPLANAWAAVLFNLLGLSNGMTLVIPDKEYDTNVFLSEIESKSISVFLLAPTMMQWALDALTKNPVSVQSIRMGIYGSAPAAPKLIKEASERFGCSLVQAYGVSEAAAGWISYLSAADHIKGLEEKPEILQSAGRAPSYFSVSVRDEDGNILPSGETGELWVKSATLMTEYLNLPDQTEEVLKDGWLITNDMAVIDKDGYIFLKDRRKFMIVSGGINVFPAGVEAVLSDHPSIKEIAVVGVPHTTWGEAVVAVIYVDGSEKPSSEELLAHCQGKLSKVMMPKHIHFVDQPLPKSANLKIQKHIIQRWFKDDPALLPESFSK